MWRLYVRAVEWFAALAGNCFGDALIFGWRMWIANRTTRCVVFAFCLAVPIVPLIVPAQMTPQERRQVERDRSRIDVLEREVIGIKADLRQLQELPSGQAAIREEIVGIKTLISERDKAFQWIITTLNAGALLAAGVWFLIRHRRPAH